MDFSFHLMILTVYLINEIQPTNERMTQTVRIPQTIRIMQIIITISPIINCVVIIMLCLALYQKLSILLISYQYENFITVGETAGYSVETISGIILLCFYISFFNINIIYRISILFYITLSLQVIYKSVLDTLKYIDFI